MAYEAPASSLSNDFSVVEGSIIIPIEGQYMVDLDSSNGLVVGDILTVVKNGERVVDSSSNKIIGTRDIAVGYLQVSRIFTGYAYTKALGNDFSPEKGETVKRFKLVPAQITTEVTKPLATLLRIQLPQLDWDAEDAMLTFSVRDNQLVVLDNQETALKSYQLNPNTGLISGDSSITSATTSSTEEKSDNSNNSKVTKTLNKTLDTLFGAIGVESGQSDKRLDIPEIGHGNMRDREIKTLIPIDEELVAITVADLNQDQRQETFVATENRIGIFQIGQSGFRFAGNISLPSETRILGLDSGDADGDGLPELYVNAATGSKLTSRIIEFKDQQYTTTLVNSDWFIRVVELQGQTTLIGQKVGTEQPPFSGPLAMLTRQGDQLSATGYIELPQDATVFAFMPMPENPTQHYVYISKSNNLIACDSQGNKIWQSEVMFTGSEIDLFTTAGQQSTTTAAPLYLQPKIQQLPSGEIVVGQNSDNKTLAQLNGQSSKLTGFAWGSKKLVQKWHTDELHGQLIDIAVGDADNDGQADLVTIFKMPEENPQNGDQSSIILYQIN
jgi:hypothetical protein